MGRLDPANGARAGPCDLRSRLRRRQHHAHPGERFPEAPMSASIRPTRCWPRRAPQTVDTRVTFAKGDLPISSPALPPVDPLQQRRLSVGREPHRLFPRPAEAAAAGRPTRHPDAAQPRGALACADAQGGDMAARGATSSRSVGGIRTVWEPARYYDVLKPLCSDLDVWEIDLPAGADRQGSGGAISRRAPACGPTWQLLDDDERKDFYETYCEAAGRGLSDARRRHHAVSLPPPVHRRPPRMI